MSEHDHSRQIDKWMKYVAILGPFLGFIFGVGSGTVIAYQAYKTDSGRITLLEGFKDKQDEFNLKTVQAISRLKALIKDTEP